jgi:hypothetical protein
MRGRCSVDVPEGKTSHFPKEVDVARRRRFQSGCLFKRGKRRKVWVARWREDVMLDNGEIGQVRRSVMLGTVADLAKKADAQMRLDAHLRPLNQRNGRPEATMRFGVFVETQ